VAALSPSLARTCRLRSAGSLFRRQSFDFCVSFMVLEHRNSSRNFPIFHNQQCTLSFPLPPLITGERQFSSSNGASIGPCVTFLPSFPPPACFFPPRASWVGGVSRFVAVFFGLLPGYGPPRPKFFYILHVPDYWATVFFFFCFCLLSFLLEYFHRLFFFLKAVAFFSFSFLFQKTAAAPSSPSPPQPPFSLLLLRDHPILPWKTFL